ncbi:MAG TPA: hypothetical protein VM053_09130 [Gemmatimonadaceae bacterium]|nr:hypothetical protein [Gemmatimonadaceae bacterium]
MKKRVSITASWSAALALITLAGSCTEPIVPTAVLPSINPRAIAICSADVRAQTLTCSDARVTQNFSSGVRKDVILGGQDVFVKLSSGGTAYDGGTGIFSSNVDVQNLLQYAMGSADGQTVNGVEVFFQSGPTVTSGTGTVTVANPDGMSSFTGPNQAYYHYGEILSPFEVSTPRPWQFQLAGSVSTFSFQVYVSSPVTGPETGLLGNIWTGSTSTTWANPANWRDGVVPDSASTATIPTDSLLASRVYPVVASNIRLTNLRVGSGSSLALGGFKLTAYGNVESVGSITGGTVRMRGVNALLGGNIDALEVTGSVKLQRATRATGAVSIAGGSLSVADKPLSIQLQ